MVAKSKRLCFALILPIVSGRNHLATTKFNAGGGCRAGGGWLAPPPAGSMLELPQQSYMIRRNGWIRTISLSRTGGALFLNPVMGVTVGATFRVPFFVGPTCSALASTVTLAARIGAAEEAAHTVGTSAVACATHLAGSSCVFLSLLVWGFPHVKLLTESVEVVRIWPTYSTPLLRGNMHYSKLFTLCQVNLAQIGPYRCNSVNIQRCRVGRE